ncbi:hypothetical protein [Limnoglobus roseus]|uniref:SMI1/KNR4 family protein n=1 Tax=Limnoglobus roseus TaxID=2598579 RepID=A0A5C1AF15_9BACT|nr:hypothetical protein [Limnoglobus roseus]QEL17145.1 hypothetical protein PX52LOC_04126 [Limnoglobus roseus]
MTEDEWLTVNEPSPMLQFVHGKGSDRKLRLFAVACCDRISRLISTEPGRRCVEVARRMADGLAIPGERRAAVIAAMGDGDTTPAAACVGAVSAYEAAVRTADHAAIAVGREHFPELFESGDRIPEWYEIAGHEELAQSHLLRDIFGNPFRPSALDPSRVSDTARSIARSAYEDRAWDRLPILADALEDAGCEEGELLGHLRGGGPHARGCWVVDLILGKE